MPMRSLSDLTALQRLAFDEFVESPCNERWVTLVGALRPKKRRDTPSCPPTPSLMHVEDLDVPRDDSRYGDIERGGAYAKDDLIMSQRRDGPQTQDVPRSNTTSYSPQSTKSMHCIDEATSRDDYPYKHFEKDKACTEEDTTISDQRDTLFANDIPQSEAREAPPFEDESSSRTNLRFYEAASGAASYDSRGAEKKTHSITVCSGSYNDDGSTVFVVPGASLAIEEIGTNNPSPRAVLTAGKTGEDIVGPGYEKRHDHLQTVLIILAIPSAVALFAFHVVFTVLGKIPVNEEPVQKSGSRSMAVCQSTCETEDREPQTEVPNSARSSSTKISADCSCQVKD